MTDLSDAAVEKAAALPFFTLAVVVSSDGFIARHPADSPANWASPEEQALFFRDVEAADWSIMGRNTHLAADRPNRRRLVFSTSTRGWQRPTQLWLDPTKTIPADLPGLMCDLHPLRRGLILGGTRVHDWFLAAGRIDRLHLSIEPVVFGTGLPVFTGQTSTDPHTIFQTAGFHMQSDDVLNPQGTRHQVWMPLR